MKQTQNNDYSFKSLPFFDEGEDSSIRLMPDSYLDSMDDLDDELASQGSSNIDEGSVSILSVEQIKGMKSEKTFVPPYKK